MLVLLERVAEAQRIATRELRELQMTKGGGKRKGGRGRGDDEGDDRDSA